MESLPGPELIAKREDEVRARIAAAGGSLDQVTLVAVTKAFPYELVANALQAGLVDLGESYAQELDEKSRQMAADGTSGADCRWHFIGGLQRNKVKLLAGGVYLWHSVDRASLINEIAKRSPGDRILIQVNMTGEDHKAGCDEKLAPALVEQARELGLSVNGLMTVGPTDSSIDPRPSFARLRQLAQRCEVDELSMGMSGDFELAVEEGSTMVRVGSALFGSRPVVRRTTGDG